jgi:hypothetical protein
VTASGWSSCFAVDLDSSESTSSRQSSTCEQWLTPWILEERSYVLRCVCRLSGNLELHLPRVTVVVVALWRLRLYRRASVRPWGNPCGRPVTVGPLRRCRLIVLRHNSVGCPPCHSCVNRGCTCREIQDVCLRRTSTDRGRCRRHKNQSFGGPNHVRDG